MKTKKLLTHALVLVAGILIGTFIINKIKLNPPTTTTISGKTAKVYFKNYRDLMEYDKKSDIKSGYFDVTKETWDEMNEVMQNVNKVRIYFGQSSEKDPVTTFFLMNEIDRRGIEATKDVKAISVLNKSPDCPKYCDVTRTYLYK